MSTPKMEQPSEASIKAALGCELAESRGSAVMSELLASFGLGPRKCRDCGEIFAVPPYMECKDWSLCEPCGSKRFLAWAQTDKGKLEIEIEKARLRLQQPNGKWEGS